MIQFKIREKIISHISVVFSVAFDIEKYHIFLPWCRKVKVISKDRGSIIAEMYIEYGPFKEHYRSVIEFFEPSFNGKEEVAEISIMGEGRLFNRLNALWLLSYNPEYMVTTVHFTIDFLFRNSFYQKLSNLFFNRVCKKVLKAFKDRVSDLNNRELLDWWHYQFMINSSCARILFMILVTLIVLLTKN